MRARDESFDDVYENGGHSMEDDSGSWVAVVMYMLFKILLIGVAAFSIYLGYKLFIAGVSGNASLVVDAKTIKGQLVNAAPGLFFAVGGIIALIVVALKSASIKVGRPQSKFPDLAHQPDDLTTNPFR